MPFILVEVKVLNLQVWGLENTKRRLELLYQNKHALKITKTPESYLVLLKIELA